MATTRKSTPKYEIYAAATGDVVLSGVSKSEARRIARGMGKGVTVRPTPFVKPSIS